MKITRSYSLSIYPNLGKVEHIRYVTSRYQLFLQHFVTQIYYHPHIVSISTAGLGLLANHALRAAKGVVRGVVNRKDEKSSCPQVSDAYCPATVQKSKDSAFDFWIGILSPWKRGVTIPAKSHRRLNQKLRNGWVISESGEIFRDGCGKWKVRVFVTKELLEAIPSKDFLGVDVGVNHGVARSDNYLGRNLGKIMKREKDSQRERSRQKHKKKPFKTLLKQQLDIEVNRALARCKKDSLSLAVENPKALANLRFVKDRWARCYFSRRSVVRAMEEGIYVQFVHPAYTSITCSHCGHVDKNSRVKRTVFHCTSCNDEFHADINAAVNIARKGQESLIKQRQSTSC